jgi:hypothetical protein
MLPVISDVGSPFAKGFAVCLGLFQRFGRSFPVILWTKPVGLPADEPCSSNFVNVQSWCCYSMSSRPSRTSRRLGTLDCTPTLFETGESVGRTACFRYRINLDVAASPRFFPLDHAIVKAIACEMVFESRVPLSRQSLADITSRARKALGKPVGRTTVWRILHADAIKPWQYEYWIYPRDPHFAQKATRIVDLYAGHWYGEPLRENDYIISSDEKTSIQARIRCHTGQEPAPHFRRRLEFEYERGGALQYLAAWDVRRGYVMGRCEPCTGIESFGRLVGQVMEQEPYCSADRVFWIVDNGSSHRGDASIRRLTDAYPNAILVHTPVHASWLNQVEIYFSLIQRKVLTPNDFVSLADVAERLRLYEELSNRNPQPFAWKFDRAKLREFLHQLETKHALPAAA